MKKKHIYLVTGCAGFIGYFLCMKLLDKNEKVIGIDSLNDYYDVDYKKKRVKILKKKKLIFYKNNLLNIVSIKNILKKYKVDVIIHLAAQAGVRHSLSNPLDYVKNNIEATTCILEACKNFKIKHFLFSSSSSVYGSSEKKKSKENYNTDFPIQFYAATKKANELMLHSYSHQLKMPVTVMRFFTVYGPFGRPDMALFKFTKNIYSKKPIDVFNLGKHSRDFTYIDDNITSIVKLISKPPKKIEIPGTKKMDYKYSNAKFRIVNVACGKQIKLTKYISLIEKYTKIKSKKNLLDLQVGDVREISANINYLNQLTGNIPKINVETGVMKFINWYKKYYKVE